MRHILFICDNIKNCNDDFNSLQKLNYKVTIISNYSDIIPFIQNNKYKYIIIDLEFDNKTGDTVCITIRKNIYKPPPILGIYGFYKLSIYKFNYNLYGFNNIATIPILNWKLFLQEARNDHLLDDNTEDFQDYIKYESNIANYMYEQYLGKKPKNSVSSSYSQSK